MNTPTKTSDSKHTRKQIVNFIESAIKESEYRFARAVIDAWLENYPGDIEMQLYLALVLMREKKYLKSITVIERISLLDPEYVPAYKLLYRAASYTDYAKMDVLTAIWRRSALNTTA